MIKHQNHNLPLKLNIINCLTLKGATFIACLGQGLENGEVPEALKKRAEKAAELHQQTGGATIVLSGRGKGKTTEAEVLEGILKEPPYSINGNALLLDKEAMNTVQNALGTLDKIRETEATGDLTIYLVTSDWHAPRAELSFRSVFDNCRKEEEGKVRIISCPAYSALRNDSADYRDELLNDLNGDDLRERTEEMMKVQQPWGIVLRLCLEHRQMETRVKKELKEKNVEVNELEPKSLTEAYNEIQALLERVREGGYGQGAPVQISQSISHRVSPRVMARMMGQRFIG